MGWSCRKDAAEVSDTWVEACLAQTKSQNTFEVKGVKYFWETSRKEHGDGAITGTIWKFVDETHVNRTGTFHIEGNGTITRAPKFLKDAAVKCKKPPRPMFEVIETVEQV